MPPLVGRKRAAHVELLQEGQQAIVRSGLQEPGQLFRPPGLLAAGSCCCKAHPIVVLAGLYQPLAEGGQRGAGAVVHGQFQPVQRSGAQVDLVACRVFVQLDQGLAKGPLGLPLHPHRRSGLGLDGPFGAVLEFQHQVVHCFGGLELHGAHGARGQAGGLAGQDVDAELDAQP